MNLALLWALLIALVFPVRTATADEPFRQAVSVRVQVAPILEGASFTRLEVDRDGIVYVLTDRGLARLVEQTLVPERSYRPLADLRPVDIAVQEGTGYLYYLYDDRFLSNRRAGKPMGHLPEGVFTHLAVSEDGTVLLEGANRLAVHGANGTLTELDQASGAAPGRLHAWRGQFYKAVPQAVYRLGAQGWEAFHRGSDLTTVAFRDGEMLVGTEHGYYVLDLHSGRETLPVQSRLPVQQITALFPTSGGVWAGTSEGAFFHSAEGSFRYYASRRWLSDDDVRDIKVDRDGNVFVLTQTGLNMIAFPMLTLAEKAGYYDRKIRQRHIRYGFIAERYLPVPGDVTTGELIDTDNDGLWSSYYLASQAFRYSVTGDQEAYWNAWETFEAFERLEAINPLEGFPSRTFERTGFKVADPERWHLAPDPEWEWKSHTSSDEVVGHMFGAAVLYETATRTDDEKARIAAFVDRIVGHIVRNDYYLIDVDGEPTLWGRWNPEYVNWYPHSIVDRRLNSTEMVAALQLAYHLTGKQLYRTEAFRLMEEHGYLENILSSMANVDYTEGYLYQDRFDMGSGWNHSDDMLAFVTYWVLHRFAFDDDLRVQYAEAIRDHWEIERIEKNPLWNFVYASTGASEFDLEGALWTLREWPLDLVRWTVRNSHRQDLTFLPENFRRQQTAELLPPGERPTIRWNANPFAIDGGNGGRTELSGDEFLLPYWMGRYLGILKSDQ